MTKRCAKLIFKKGTIRQCKHQAQSNCAICSFHLKQSKRCGGLIYRNGVFIKRCNRIAMRGHTECYMHLKQYNETLIEYGKCGFCGDQCNPLSQTCGRC